MTRESLLLVSPKQLAMFSGVPCSRASICVVKCILEGSALTLDAFVVEFGAHSEGGRRLYYNGTYTSSCFCTSELAASMALCSLRRWPKNTSTGVEEVDAFLERKKLSVIKMPPKKDKIVSMNNYLYIHLHNYIKKISRGQRT